MFVGGMPVALLKLDLWPSFAERSHRSFVGGVSVAANGVSAMDVGGKQLPFYGAWGTPQAQGAER